MALAQLAYEQFKTLPDEQAREVLDFIGYLKSKQDRAEWQDLMNAQAESMKAVWDNPEDEVWNDFADAISAGRNNEFVPEEEIIAILDGTGEKLRREIQPT